MSLFSKLFGKGNKEEKPKVDPQAQVEEFFSLISIYGQAYIVTHFGITDLKLVPEFATYKRMMRIPTVGGKLGVAEKSQIKKMMMSDYGMSETFFKTIDASIRKNCKGIRDVQGYFFAYGNMTNDLLSLLYSEYPYKLQASIVFKSLLKATVSDCVDKLMTKSNWKSFKVNEQVMRLRSASTTLGYGSDWLKELAYQTFMQSKKRKKQVA